MYWGGPRALWLVVSAVATNMVTQAVFAVISRRMLPALSFSWRLANLKGAREVMSFGTWMVIGRIGYMIYVGSDIIVLKKFATAVDETNYKLGAELYMQIQVMISLSLGTLLPALTAMYAQKDRERLRASYLRGCRYILWLTMLVSCPVFV